MTIMNLHILVLKLDGKTGWLWIFSMLGIVAFPPSVLFISEFLMVKTMLFNKYYIMCGIFLLLLTIILYGLAKPIIRMCFLAVNTEKEMELKENVKHLSWNMYIPQIIMLIIAFVLGIYQPDFIAELIQGSAYGF